MDFSNIKLIVLDIDGVLTNGRKIYNRQGEVLAKEFYDKDFSTLNKLNEKYKIIFLSGDDRVNEPLFRNRCNGFFKEHKNKWGVLRKILNEYNLSPNSNVVFIGDDWPDIECLQNIKYSFCPADAIPQVKKVAYRILNTNGGNGVINEIYELLNSNSI